MYKDNGNIFIFTDLIQLLFELVYNYDKKFNYVSYKERNDESEKIIETLSDKFDKFM